MKQTFISWLVLLSSLFAMQAKAQTNVTVVYQEGSQEILQVKEEGGLYFFDDNLIISTVQGNSRTFALSSIHKLLFSTGTVGLQTIIDDGAMAIYPNPVSDVLNVANSGSESLSYSILSVNGALLDAGSLTVNGTIDVSALSAGFYFLKIDGQTLKFTKL